MARRDTVTELIAEAQKRGVEVDLRCAQRGPERFVAWLRTSFGEVEAEAKGPTMAALKVFAWLFGRLEARA